MTDNGTLGWLAHHVNDNGTTTTKAGNTTAGSLVTDIQTQTLNCAASYHGGTYYLAVADDETTITTDNVSVWKSTDMIAWTQIGVGRLMAGTVNSLAIATIGTTADDSNVFIAVNDGAIAKVLRFSKSK